MRPPRLKLPHRLFTPRHPPADHVNEVHFAFLDGAPETPATNTPRSVPPMPSTPSLRAIRPAHVVSATGAPTSVRHLVRMLAFLILLGIIPSTIVFLIDLTVHSIFLAREDAIAPDHGFAGVLLYTASGLALCLASTFVCHIFSQEAEGSGIPAMKSLLSGFYDRQKPSLSLWCLLAKAIGLVCAIGGGLPVGWEGPNLHISCIVAHHLSRLPPFRPLRKDRALRIQIIACACAVGLASSFGTPIGGVLYALETTSSFYLVPTFWKCMLSTLAGSLVYDLLYKTPLVQAFDNTKFGVHDYTVEQLSAFLLLGVILGVIGAFFVRCVHGVYFLRKHRMPGTNRYVLLTVVAVLAALLQYPRSLFRQDPRHAVNDMFSSQTNMEMTPLDIILLILIKFPLVVVSIGLPVPAGVFIPCFLLGSGFGRLYGELLQLLFGNHIVPGGYAVVGAAAFTAGVTRALSVAVVIFEVTGQLRHMVPTLAAVLIAVIVANGINRSLYDTLIIMKELPYMPHMRRDRSPLQRVHEIMQTDVVALQEKTTLGEIRQVLDTHPTFDSFPIVTKDYLLVGSVRRRTLLAMLNGRSRNRARAQPENQKPEPLAESTEAPKVEVNGEVDEKKQSEPAPRANGDLGVVNGSSVEHETPRDSNLQLSSQSDQDEEAQYGRNTETTLEPDLGPLVVTESTTLSQLHFMFVMLMPTHAFVLIGGELQGVITRGDLVQSGTFVSGAQTINNGPNINPAAS